MTELTIPEDEVDDVGLQKILERNVEVMEKQFPNETDMFKMSAAVLIFRVDAALKGLGLPSTEVKNIFKTKNDFRKAVHKIMVDKECFFDIGDKNIAIGMDVVLMPEHEELN